MPELASSMTGMAQVHRLEWNPLFGCLVLNTARPSCCGPHNLDTLLALLRLRQVFCGMLARMGQFADIVAHSKRAEAAGAPRHQV